MSNISELKERLVAANKAASLALAEYNAALCAQYKFKVGDMIKSSKGERAKVTRVFVIYGQATYEAVGFKKDGTLGVRPVPSYRPEWDKAEITTEST